MGHLPSTRKEEQTHKVHLKPFLKFLLSATR